MLEQVTLSFPYNDKCFGHKSTENPNIYLTGKKNYYFLINVILRLVQTTIVVVEYFGLL